MTLLHVLTEQVSKIKTPSRPLIIGINGVDGSGKTTMASNLADTLRQRGSEALVLSVDDFHFPRAHRARRGELSPEGFRFDSIDFESIATQALHPLRTAEAFPIRIATATRDLAQDRSRLETATVDAGSVVIVEGIFLFQAPVLPLLDFKIFVDVTFDTVLKRVVERDAVHFGTPDAVIERYTKKYIPGQMLYLDEVEPKKLADVVINNNDWAQPKIITASGQVQPGLASIPLRRSI